MMEVVSYGNQIRCGKYELHSKFCSAANFVSKSDFVFLVNENVGAGPINIVLHGIEMDPLRTLVVENDCLFLNNEKFSFTDSATYNPWFEFSNFDIDKFQLNLLSFESALIEYSPPKSLVFLLDDQRKDRFKSIFEIEFIRRLEDGIKIFLSDDILSGIRMLKGLGPGLTPSGDDFNSGVLIALNLLQKITNIEYSRTINQIFQTAIGENQFTNVFLKCAARGLLFEKFKKLVQSLVYFDEGEIIESTKRVLTSGETSGADQAVGFLFGLKRF